MCDLFYYFVLRIANRIGSTSSRCTCLLDRKQWSWLKSHPFVSKDATVQVIRVQSKFRGIEIIPSTRVQRLINRHVRLCFMIVVNPTITEVVLFTLMVCKYKWRFQHFLETRHTKLTVKNPEQRNNDGHATWLKPLTLKGKVEVIHSVQIVCFYFQRRQDRRL